MGSNLPCMMSTSPSSESCQHLGRHSSMNSRSSERTAAYTSRPSVDNSAPFGARFTIHEGRDLVRYQYRPSGKFSRETESLVLISLSSLQISARRLTSLSSSSRWDDSVPPCVSGITLHTRWNDLGRPCAGVLALYGIGFAIRTVSPPLARFWRSTARYRRNALRNVGQLHH